MLKPILVAAAAIGISASPANAQLLGGVTGAVNGALGGSISGGANGSLGGVLNSVGGLGGTVGGGGGIANSVTGSIANSVGMAGSVEGRSNASGSGNVGLAGVVSGAANGAGSLAGSVSGAANNAASLAGTVNGAANGAGSIAGSVNGAAWRRLAGGQRQRPGQWNWLAGRVGIGPWVGQCSGRLAAPSDLALRPQALAIPKPGPAGAPIRPSNFTNFRGLDLASLRPSRTPSQRDGRFRLKLSSQFANDGEHVADQTDFQLKNRTRYSPAARQRTQTYLTGAPPDR